MDKRITQVKFEAEDSAWNTTIKISDMDVSVSPEFWADTPYDKAISGVLRHNLRGFRLRIQLDFDGSNEASTFRTLKNNIIGSVSDDFTYFYPDADNADKIEVVFDQFAYDSIYNKTVGRFVPSFTMTSYDILSTIPLYLQSP